MDAEDEDGVVAVSEAMPGGPAGMSARGPAASTAPSSALAVGSGKHERRLERRQVFEMTRFNAQFVNYSPSAHIQYLPRDYQEMYWRKGCVIRREPTHAPRASVAGAHRPDATSLCDAVVTPKPSRAKVTFVIDTDTLPSPPVPLVIIDEVKPSLFSEVCASPKRYKAAMATNSERMLPPLILSSNNVRLVNSGALESSTPGPGETHWEHALGGSSIGPHSHLIPGTRGRSPSRDPQRPSLFVTATGRDAGHTLEGGGQGADAFYRPSAPDFGVWLGKGFSQPCRLRVIEPEKWGPSSREPKDPALTAQHRAEACELDKRGLPCTTAKCAEASPRRRSLSEMSLYAAAKAVLRSDAASPYAHVDAVGPGYSYPPTHFNAMKAVPRELRDREARPLGPGAPDGRISGRRSASAAQALSPKMRLLATADLKAAALAQAVVVEDANSLRSRTGGPVIYYDGGRFGAKYSGPIQPLYTPPATAVQTLLNDLRRQCSDSAGGERPNQSRLVQ